LKRGKKIQELPYSVIGIGESTTRPEREEGTMNYSNVMSEKRAESTTTRTKV
jgi:hypothetical protein